jgi:hypothetical protein
MSSFVTRRQDGTITVSPKKEEDQSALVVIAHGLGDTAEGFADVAEVRDSSVTNASQWADWILYRLLTTHMAHFL